MMAAGIFWAALHGNMDAVTNGALESTKEAVSLCITMLGIMSFWCGILKIGENAGLIGQLTRNMRPVIRFLFPNLPADHPAAKHISTNMIANMLGLGWAAQPAGTASNEMCTFLIVNISSLQLIPINMIAYRSQYGSMNPAAIVGPALLATTVSTLAGIVFCKIMDRRR